MLPSSIRTKKAEEMGVDLSNPSDDAKLLLVCKCTLIKIEELLDTTDKSTIVDSMMAILKKDIIDIIKDLRNIKERGQINCSIDAILIPLRTARDELLTAADMLSGDKDETTRRSFHHSLTKCQHHLEETLRNMPK